MPYLRLILVSDVLCFCKITKKPFNSYNYLYLHPVSVLMSLIVAKLCGLYLHLRLGRKNSKLGAIIWNISLTTTWMYRIRNEGVKNNVLRIQLVRWVIFQRKIHGRYSIPTFGNCTGELAMTSRNNRFSWRHSAVPLRSRAPYIRLQLYIWYHRPV